MVPIDKARSQHQAIHIGAQETLNRLFRRSYHRFVFIERRIQQNRDPGPAEELRDQSVVQRVRLLRDTLQSSAAIDVSDCRDLFTDLWSDREYFLHVRSGFIDFEPPGNLFFQDAWGERPELLAEFDPQIDNVPHIRATWVCQERPVPKRSRTELHATLEPAHHVAIENGIDRCTDQVVFREQVERYSILLYRVLAFVIGRFAAPVGVVLHKGSGLSEYTIPDIEGRAEGRPVIGGTCGDVDLFVGGEGRDLAVGDRVHRHAAGHADVFRLGFRLEAIEHVQDDFLRHNLQAFCDVFMAMGHRFFGIAGGSECFNQFVAIERMDRRSPVVPVHPDPFFVVREIVQVQFERITFGNDDFSEQVHELRFSVGCQSHDFVLIAVVRESQVHCDRRVEKADRVREEDSIEFRPIGTASVRREGAREIPHAIDTQDIGIVEGGDQEPGGDVCLVVFDAVESSSNRFFTESDCMRKLIFESESFPLSFETIEDSGGGRQMPEYEPQAF